MRIVLDTNVLVSAFLVSVGPSARIVSAWRSGKIEVVTSQELLSELAHTLNYPRLQKKHHKSLQEIADIVMQIGKFSIVVSVKNIPHISRDADDDIVLATAVEGEASYIVTGDPDLLTLKEYEGIRIMTPAACMILLNG